jgi:hypothetical protein
MTFPLFKIELEHRGRAGVAAAQQALEAVQRGVLMFARAVAGEVRCRHAP